MAVFGSFRPHAAFRSSNTRSAISRTVMFRPRWSAVGPTQPDSGYRSGRPTSVRCTVRAFSRDRLIRRGIAKRSHQPMSRLHLSHDDSVWTVHMGQTTQSPVGIISFDIDFMYGIVISTPITRSHGIATSVLFSRETSMAKTKGGVSKAD